MATSVRSILDCIGVDTGGTVSILGRMFGFSRGRVPPDPDTSVTAEVSVLQLVRDLQGRHIHVNVIRVGFDALSATDQDEAFQKLDYAIYRTRNIYRPVSLGVGRVEHYVIDAADSNGRDDIGSEDEAEALADEWSVPNNAIDAFVVRNISDDDFVGRSPIGGNCDKNEKDDGLIAGEIGRGFEAFSRTFAHEIGHFLGLEHNHGSGDDCDNCPSSTNGCNNLMAQTRCANCCGGGTRVAVLLTSGQGSDMRGHCSVRNGC
ncbi:MAG: hypothetical protein K2X74_10250 [Acetobacteraceae bacterium]|nr:hypothetical protein [Acetobacteraceae bacterium]